MNDVSVAPENAADRCLPPGLVVARTTRTWTPATLPPGLRSVHRAGTWAELIVISGSVEFVEVDSGYSATATSDRVVVIVPERDHYITPSSDASFAIRFHRFAEETQ